MTTQIRKATIEDLDQLSTLFDSYRVFYKKQSNVNEAKFKTSPYKKVL